MSEANPEEDLPADIADRIRRVGRYSRLSKVGFAVVAAAFLLAVVAVLPYNLDSVPSAVDAVLMPLTFLGIGLLLLGIGMHLHLLHLNLVRQIDLSERESEGSREGDG